MDIIFLRTCFYLLFFSRLGSFTARRIFSFPLFFPCPSRPAAPFIKHFIFCFHVLRFSSPTRFLVLFTPALCSVIFPYYYSCVRQAYQHNSCQYLSTFCFALSSSLFFWLLTLVFFFVCPSRKPLVAICRMRSSPCVWPHFECSVAMMCESSDVHWFPNDYLFCLSFL